MTIRNQIIKLLREEDYSPAGIEVTPNKIVVHVSVPMNRDKILQDGLKVRAGECYKIYVGYGVKCKPAIFATNSTNKRAWFDSTYDDDIWEINTEMIPDVKWYKDKHYDSRSKHIVTFQDIPLEAITLTHKGSGNDWGNINENFSSSFIRRIDKIDDFITNLINNSYPCDHKSGEIFLHVIKEESIWLIREVVGLNMIELYEILDYIDKFKSNEIIEYWNKKCIKLG